MSIFLSAISFLVVDSVAAQSQPQTLSRIVFYDLDNAGSHINPLMTKVAGLIYATPGGAGSSGLAALGINHGSQLATFHLGVVLSSPSWHLTGNYNWTIDSPDTPGRLYIPSSQQHSQRPDGYCLQPGVFHVYCQVEIQDESGTQTTTENLESDCAVIGGKLVFTGESVSPTPPDHEYNDPTQPYYLTHFGFGVSESLPGGAQRQRDEIMIGPEYPQPDGTEMDWIVPLPFHNWMDDWFNDPTFCLAYLSADDHTSPKAIEASYFLSFTGMWGDVANGLCADDTASSWVTDSLPSSGLNSNKVAVRRPHDLISHHRYNMTGLFPTLANPDNNHTAAQVDDFMQILDLDNGVPMPAIWVQERWIPDPSELTTNAETQSGPWVTNSSSAQNNYNYGVCTTADHLGYMWPSLPATPNPLQIDNQYYLAATSSSVPTAFGIQVGLFSIEFTPSTGGHWGVAVHIKN